MCQLSVDLTDLRDWTSFLDNIINVNIKLIYKISLIYIYKLSLGSRKRLLSQQLFSTIIFGEREGEASLKACHRDTSIEWFSAARKTARIAPL